MASLHPAATQHVPAFITEPGQTDVLLSVGAVTLIGAIMAVGVFFFWLHSLPERMVHNKLHYDLVAVLALLSLFTHVHAFWVAALLLAFIKFPDFSIPDFHGPLQNIATSLDKLAAKESAPPAPAPAPGPPPAPPATARQPELGG